MQTEDETINLKYKVRAMMAERGYTFEKLAQRLNEVYEIKESKNNISNKLSRGTLRFIELKRIADVLDFDINFVSRKK